MDRKRALAILGVMVGATLFGFLGITTRYFNDERGLGSIDIVVIRLTFASLLMLIILGIAAHDKLRISRKDIPILVIFGIFKISSDVTFFYAQTVIHLGLATLLQMTAPYYVMIVSLFLFREKLTLKKIVAMSIATTGAILVTGILFGEDVRIEVTGVLSALLSGVFFGMFMVGSKICNDRGIHPAASLFYTMLFADAIALLLCNHGALVEAVSDFDGLAMGMALGVALTLMPFFLYGWSTQFIEPTLASMVSVLEIVSAVLVGYFIFSETLSAIRIIGIGLVIASIIFVNVRFHKDYEKKYGKYVPPRYDEDE